MTDDAHLYRPCVGVALFNSEGLVFVGERIDTPGAWQMPQGGINENEAVEIAAMRELEEEVGTRNAEIIGIAPRRVRYHVPQATADRLWKGRYIGQEQSWIAARFLGHDGEFNLNGEEAPEFSAWQWIKLEDTINLIVPFKRDAYREVIEMMKIYARP